MDRGRRPDRGAGRPRESAARRGAAWRDAHAAPGAAGAGAAPGRGADAAGAALLGRAVGRGPHRAPDLHRPDGHRRRRPVADRVLVAAPWPASRRRPGPGAARERGTTRARTAWQLRRLFRVGPRARCRAPFAALPGHARPPTRRAARDAGRRAGAATPRRTAGAARGAARAPPRRPAAGHGVALASPRRPLALVPGTRRRAAHGRR